MTDGPISVQPNWKNFFFPRLTRAYIGRLLAVMATACVVFSFILTPFRIRGHSMEPTYRDGGFNFCNKLRFVFTPPREGDVVVIRLAGDSIMLLKRVVATGGDVVEFRKGRLFVNQRAVSEPYVHDPQPWRLPPRRVEPGHLYVVGDNRRVSIHIHQFGQTSRDRIIGGPLW